MSLEAEGTPIASKPTYSQMIFDVGMHGELQDF